MGIIYLRLSQIRISCGLQTADCGRFFFILLLIFSIWFYPSFLLAQSHIKIEGHIYDQDDNHPIYKAISRIVNTNYDCRTDNSGFFFFEKIPVGTYSLEFSAPGYESQVFSPVTVNEDMTTRIDVQLKKKTFYIPGLEITSDREPLKIISIQTIERSQIEKMSAKTLPEIIENISGVLIQEGGGRQEVSIRGSSPEHVLVLLDGHKINPSGTGIADLSTIPLEMVEKVEILKGGQSAQYGADALGGVINIITLPSQIKKPLRFELDSHLGEWDTENISSSLSKVFSNKLHTKLAYSHQYSQNDFKIWVYDDPKKREFLKSQGENGDSTTTRKNAYKKASNYFLAGNYVISPKAELSFSGEWYRSKNGLPGSYGWMDAYQRAWVKDERRFVSLKHTYRFSPGFLLENDFGWSRFQQHFQNDTNIIFNTKYVDDVAEFSSLVHLKIYQDNQLKIGAQFQGDVLHHTDLIHPDLSMGKINRTTMGVFFSDEQQLVLPRILFFQKINSNFALRWDHSKTLKDFLSPQTGMTLSRGERYRISFRANYGKSYRQPSNNALFWKEDAFAEGNPNLLPEKSKHSEAGGEISLPWFGNWSAGMTCFHNIVTNLIEWQRRFDGRYNPVNIYRAKIYGHEDFICWKSPKDILEINYNNTVCYAKNKSGDRIYDGKFIPFKPRYITNLNLSFDYKIFETLYKIRWVSEHFTGPANSLGQREEPYQIEDLMVGLKKRFGQVETKLRFEWDNISDEEYELIYRHPMPGRGWGVSLAIVWERK